MHHPSPPPSDPHADSGQPRLLRRRHVLTLGVALSVTPVWWPARSLHAAEIPDHSPAAITPDAALQQLMEGNQRFIRQQPQHPDQSAARVKSLAQAQHPFVTILSCADSRVPAELIFDQGLGSIFDVRIAGNIATPEALGSIEYAVVLLGTPLLMVLGHERCGAVTAAVQNQPLPGKIGSFVKAIQPAVQQVANQPGDAVNNAVTANVRYQMTQVMQSPLLQERSQAGQLKIVGGRYDLDTGRVTMIT